MKNRVPHFSNGNDKIDYLSCAKNQFVAHDLSLIKQGNIERQNNGLELRKSHFSFGTDKNPHQNTDLLGF
jgi:hypothetical protein